MRHLKPADYRRMSWKNGGGMTTEIAVASILSEAPARPFAWRVSIADVEADGPFSLFPGYDRHILLLAGKGMRIDAGINGLIDLSQPFEPKKFSGDWSVDGHLIDGPVRDFNVMVDRSLAMAEIELFRPGSRTMPLPVGQGETLLVHAVTGGAHIFEAKTLAASDTLILEVSDPPVSLDVGVATLVAVRIRLNGRSLALRP